jgi:phosphatidate cytidylyltransferase
VSERTGDGAGAAHLEAALELYARLAMPLEEARCRAALARVLELADRRTRTGARSVMADIAGGALCIAYVAVLGGFAVLLTAQDGGQWWTLSFVSIVVATDVFAYASGLLLGKHPMAPRISPKKTWEGFAGSALAAVVVATVLAPWLLGEPIWFGPVLGLVLVATGTVGDLIESLVKRDIGIKDISGWLPGHGGFLDRIDGILPSAAAALLLFLVAH